MSVRKLRRFLLPFSIASLAATSWPWGSASAQFYLRPRLGAVVPVRGGDVSYSVGLTGGYHWTRSLATQASYARFIATGNAADGDLLVGEGVLGFPLKFFTPYATAGGGTVRGAGGWKGLVSLGSGLSLGPFLFLTVGVGFDYALVFDAPDYFEPVAWIGLSF